MSLDIERPEKSANERYPIISFIGPPGSGKSSLVDTFSDITGAKKIVEPFEENPYLEYFYRTGKAAYDCQATFLIDRFFEMNNIPNYINEHMVAGDSTIYGDEIMFEALRELGLVTDFERKKYWLSAEHIDSLVIHPDILFYLYAEPSEVDARVRARARPMEMEVYKWNPTYFMDMARIFEEKICEDMEWKKGIIRIDTSRFNVTRQSENVVKECCNQARYYIESPNGRGLGGVGSDSSRLIVPDFLRPLYRDYSQESWESLRLRGT